MARRRLSVSMLVAATLVTVTTVLLAIFGALDYAGRSKEEWTRLRRVTAAQTDELAVALSLPVWNIDRPQIDRIIDSQSSVSPITGLIVDAAGKTQARVRNAHGRFVVSDGHFPTEGLLTETRPILHESERIGTVRIYATSAIVQRQLRMELIRTVASIITIDFLLIVGVYFVLFRAVLRPIVAIERYAGAVSAEGAVNAPPIQPAPTAEPESLRLSIESMVRLLDHRYAELQEEVARRRESEERFRGIFESVNDAIFILDRGNARILDVNRRMTEMFGYTREEARELAFEALMEGDGNLFEWQTHHKDGHHFWVEVGLRTAVIDGIERVVAVVRDVDQRKQMERELRRAETMSAMGSLVAGVAHEVRNPLFGMSALLDAYADEMTTPDQRELSAGLREQITRLTHLMRELLEFGRPVETTSEPNSLGDLVHEVLRSRGREAADARITLRSTIDPALPPLPMDRSRLRQVFENLVDNAAQHAPAVRNVTIGATLVVRAERRWIDCSVEDDGHGFNPADLEKVFEPFFTRRERGTGLGLSIVQRIVEEHGGNVTAANRVEGGAVVTVRLPV